MDKYKPKQNVKHQPHRGALPLDTSAGEMGHGVVGQQEIDAESCKAGTVLFRHNAQHKYVSP